ncbi:MAG: hypothetical protein FWE05_11845 [Defluviitaleaceae bacterium]|nr:hypothetical protein [Defluviitaleaceae bacterium]
MNDDTSLVRMVVEGLAKKHNWTYEVAIEAFYKSDTCRALSDRETGVFTFAPREIIELFDEGFIYSN